MPTPSFANLTPEESAALADGLEWLRLKDERERRYASGVAE